MRDVFDAIEQLSALLSFRIENQARSRGWASKPYSWLMAPEDGKLIIMVATTLYLPDGVHACFTPRNNPEANGAAPPSRDGWVIDVRRTDSVIRDSWADGIGIQKTDKKYVLWYRSAPLDDRSLGDMIDDLARP